METSERQAFRVGTPDGLAELHKNSIKIKAIAELNEDELEVYNRTNSLIYACVSVIEYEDMGICCDEAESGYQMIDAAFKLLLEGKVKFDCIDIRDDEFSLLVGEHETESVPLPKPMRGMGNYAEAEALILELQEKLP